MSANTVISRYIFCYFLLSFLVISWISGISLLGSSTEIYLYGVQYMFFLLVSFLAGFVISYIYLPVFHDLQLTSIYEVI